MWYFAPAYQAVRETGPRLRPMPAVLVRRFIVHTLPRLLLFAGLIKTLLDGNWIAAGIICALMVWLGLMHWLVARFIIRRLGGTHARSDV